MQTYELFIGGKWEPGSSRETFVATSPATGERIATLARGTRDDVDRAVDAARQVAPDLAAASAWERAEWCERVADVLSTRANDVALLISRDQGKPLHSEATAEVATAIQGFRDAAAHVKHLTAEAISAADPRKRIWSRRVPRGVYAVVTPWNFPVNIPTEYLGPALATGNPVVWIPAPTTSLAAIALAEAIEAADIPPGAINLVTGEGPVVGDAAVSHPGVDGVGFTGSSATGRRIAERGAGKAQLLELGGNGPTIVYADADLGEAAAGIAVGCFTNAGQICSASEVIFAQDAIALELAELLVAEAKKINLGHPEDPSTTMGPLNNAPVAAKVDRHLADARNRGARVLTGGRRAPEHGSELFYEPTVLTDVSTQSELVSEETFGPVAPIVPFDDERSMRKLACSPQFGLVASVWTRNATRAIRTAEALRAGIVNINDSSAYWEIHIPFGGGPGTNSGLGRLGGMHTLRAMTELQTITLNLENS